MVLKLSSILLFLFKLVKLSFLGLNSIKLLLSLVKSERDLKAGRA